MNAPPFIGRTCPFVRCLRTMRVRRLTLQAMNIASKRLLERSSTGSRRRQSRGWRGFTVIEMLTVIAVLAVLVALAAPSFSGMVDRYRVSAAADELTNALQFARSEAVRTRANVVLRGQSATCRSQSDPKNWSCGFLVFVDTNGNNTQEMATEPTVREVGEFTNMVLIHDSASIAYGPYGSTVSSPGRFTIYPLGAGSSSPATTTLCISSGGRIRTLRNTTTCS